MDDWTKLHVDIAKALKEYSDKTHGRIDRIVIETNIKEALTSEGVIHNLYIVNCYKAGS